MSLSGQVEDLGVAELLYMVGISRRSGLLRLEGRAGEFEILFRSGLVAAAHDRKAPSSLHDFLVRAGLVDATHLAVLERQATQQGKPLAELLAEESILPAGTLEEQLRLDVERVLARALELRDGTFSFHLVADETETADQRFGGLTLREGLRPDRVPGVAERSSSGGLSRLGGSLSLPRTEGGRQVELLVDDSDISLPILPAPGASSTSGGSGEAASAPVSAAPRALLSIGWPALGRLLQEALEAAGMRVIRPRGVREAAERIERAVGSGASVTVVGDATLTALPGLELLARAKLVHRATRAILLLDRRGTPAQVAAHRERAERLGVTHVLLQAPGDGEEEARLAVEELTQLILAPPPRDEAAEPEPIQALPAGPEDPPPWMLGPARAAERLGSQPVELQDRQLGSILRELASLRSSTDLAARLLAIGAEYGERAVLFSPSETGVRARGFGARDAATHARLAATLPRLRLPAADADLPCACLRDGRSRRVPAALAGAGLIAALGGARPREVAALPLLVSGRPVAVLVLDDAAGESELPSLAALERFLAGAAVPLEENLERDRARALVRRQRALP